MTTPGEVRLHGARAAGRVALVDEADYALVSAYRWHVREEVRAGRNVGPYARASVKREDGRWAEITMHGLITGYRQTDHINHDGLDNRRANLRPADASQNHANERVSTGSRRTSAYKGVCWNLNAKRWHVQLTKDRHRHHLGYFDDEIEAARAYDMAAREMFGEYAALNFPDAA